MEYLKLKQEGTCLINQSLDEMPSVDKQTANQMKAVLSTTLTELEGCGKMLEHPSALLSHNNKIEFINCLPENSSVACQGVAGSYQNIACEKVFSTPNISFYTNFEDVPKAVAENEVDFGILPIENSSAGEVDDVIEFVCRHNCYINTIVQIKIEHCLAGIKGSKREDITVAYSHPQALRQSADYLKYKGIQGVAATNTATAAKQIAQNGKFNEACVCSELGAKLYDLDILDKGIQDSEENYTRFICISKKALVLPKAEIVAVTLSFPNQTGALSRLLTRFSVFHLDLTKIQSMPIGGADFNVRFHLDFKGKISDPRVSNLLGHMYETYHNFQFLGNYQILP